MSFSLVGTAVDLIVVVLSTVGLAGLFGLMAVESFGIPPLPGEVILAFAGFLVAQGTFPLVGTVLAALAGGLAGSFAGYAIGRWGRHRLTEVGIGALRLEERHLARMDAFFARRGELTVAVARLIPLARAYISYPAGTARMDPVRFAVYTVVGATPFTLGLLYAGFVLRSNWQTVTRYFHALDYAAVAVIAVGVVYLLLLAGGLLAPGWPPRRPRAAAPTSSGSDP